MASFHCCGTSPPVHTSTRMAWKRSRTMGSAGSSILSSSATRESGPGAFQLCIPRIDRLVSSSVGADPSGTKNTFSDHFVSEEALSEEQVVFCFGKNGERSYKKKVMTVVSRCTSKAMSLPAPVLRDVLWVTASSKIYRRLCLH